MVLRTWDSDHNGPVITQHLLGYGDVSRQIVSLSYREILNKSTFYLQCLVDQLILYHYHVIRFFQLGGRSLLNEYFKNYLPKGFLIPKRCLFGRKREFEAESLSDNQYV